MKIRIFFSYGYKWPLFAFLISLFFISLIFFILSQKTIYIGSVSIVFPMLESREERIKAWIFLACSLVGIFIFLFELVLGFLNILTIDESGLKIQVFNPGSGSRVFIANIPGYRNYGFKKISFFISWSDIKKVEKKKEIFYLPDKKGKRKIDAINYSLVIHLYDPYKYAKGSDKKVSRFAEAGDIFIYFPNKKKLDKVFEAIKPFVSNTSYQEKEYDESMPD